EHENLAIDQRLREVFAPVRSRWVPTRIHRVCFLWVVNNPALVLNPCSCHLYRFLDRFPLDPAVDERSRGLAVVAMIASRGCCELKKEHGQLALLRQIRR